MYTVVRFVGSEPCEERLQHIGAWLNATHPGLFQGLDQRDYRFSCSLQSDGDWESHRRALYDFLQIASPIIREARRAGIQVECDVAIEPEDRGAALVTCCTLDVELLANLAKHEVLLTFSVYWG